MPQIFAPSNDNENDFFSSSYRRSFADFPRGGGGGGDDNVIATDTRKPKQDRINFLKHISQNFIPRTAIDMLYVATHSPVCLLPEILLTLHSHTQPDDPQGIIPESSTYMFLKPGSHWPIFVTHDVLPFFVPPACAPTDEAARHDSTVAQGHDRLDVRERLSVHISLVKNVFPSSVAGMPNAEGPQCRGLAWTIDNRPHFSFISSTVVVSVFPTVFSPIELTRGNFLLAHKISSELTTTLLELRFQSILYQDF